MNKVTHQLLTHRCIYVTICLHDIYTQVISTSKSRQLQRLELTVLGHMKAAR